MNERIQELALQALKHPDTDNDGLTVFDNDELKKFAELIVRECAKIVNENDCEGSIVGDGMLFEHFGVEE